MSRSDVGHDRGALRGTITLVLSLALVAGGVAAWRYDLLDRFRDDAAAPGPDDPAALAPPPGVQAPAVTVPGPVAAASPATRALDPGAVRRALAPYLDDPDLGRRVLAEVVAVAGGPAVVVRGGPRDTAIPASTTKVVTTAAALLALGPDHVFTTEVRARGDRLTLVGGGDPFLERGPTSEGEAWPYPARADLQTLARRTAVALRSDGVRRVRLSYDASLFSGPSDNPTWEPDYVSSGEVSPTSALWVDQGRDLDGFARVADPAAEAARSFALALTRAGIAVRGDVVEGTAPDTAPIAGVDSAPLGRIVERILDVSDDDAAEVLLRHVGLAATGEGSIEAGRDGVRSLLGAQDVVLGASVFHDGSGLSRANRADPSVLAAVLRLAASPEHPELRAVVSGLPVAGFTGSLTDRMDAGPPAGLGRVRAKTGTLSAVFSLAGLATDLDGNVLVFVLMVDRVRPPDTLDAQATLDSAAAALGACSCGRRG